MPSLDDNRYLNGASSLFALSPKCPRCRPANDQGRFLLKLVLSTVDDVKAVDVYVRNQSVKAELAGIDFKK